MKRFRRELSFDLAVFHEGIFKNNQITLFPCFTFMPKTGGGFYCVQLKKSEGGHLTVQIFSLYGFLLQWRKTNNTV